MNQDPLPGGSKGIAVFRISIPVISIIPGSSSSNYSPQNLPTVLRVLRCVHTIQLHVLIHSIWHHGTTALSDHCTFPCNAEATCAISFFLGLTSWNPPCVVSKGKLKVPTYQSNQSTVPARATGGLSVGFRVTKRPQLWSFSRMWCLCVWKFQVCFWTGLSRYSTVTTMMLHPKWQ